MPDATGDLIKRTFSVGQERHARDSRMVASWGLVAFAILVLVAASVFFMGISLPAIKGPGFDHTEYYRECTVGYVVVPRALPIGMVAGVPTSVAVAQLGYRGGRMLAASISVLFGLATVVALALLLGNGPPGPSYASADPADIFLMAVLPIGVPVVIGAVLGGRIAAIS